MDQTEILELLQEDNHFKFCGLKALSDPKCRDLVKEKDLVWVERMRDAYKQWGKWTEKQQQVADRLTTTYRMVITAAVEDLPELFSPHITHSTPKAAAVDVAAAVAAAPVLREEELIDGFGDF